MRCYYLLVRDQDGSMFNTHFMYIAVTHVVPFIKFCMYKYLLVPISLVSP